MSKFIDICFGLVSSERRGICFNGRTLHTKVSNLNNFNFNDFFFGFFFSNILYFVEQTNNCRARGVFYVTTNPDPPFARGYPAEEERSNDSKYAGLRK